MIRVSSLKLKRVKKVLRISFVFSSLYGIIFSFFFSSKANFFSPRGLLSSKKKAREDFKFERKSKPFKFYMSRIGNRKIFRFPSLSNDLQIDIDDAKGEMVDIESLRLIGITIGEIPQAIIEDEEKGAIYFVREGDFLERFRVKSIYKEKVILEYLGEEFELTLY
ncbi:MAG: hypothetical protein B6D55_04880 [Candidatus Omnitrophica bacterium 4484_70.2]|nr:MAG: hypothetical protein B6D55_04880 [Candidatus Omnitrophica bacterium 4484_70.2]